MAKQRIPIYDICNLTDHQHSGNDLLAEDFGGYLRRHSAALHHPHRHHFYHLVLFTAGTGSHTIDFTRFKVKPFDIYFMIPGQVHSWQFESETDGFIINFSENVFQSFLLNPNYLERFSFFDGISEDCVCHIPQAMHVDIIALFKEIVFLSGQENSLDMIRLLLLRLFILIDKSSKPVQKKKLPQSNHIMLRNFRKLIDQHYMSIRLPKQYAELLYITPNHLNSLSQDILGKSAGELIRDRILLEAKRLLTNEGSTVTEIAYSLNFQDNSYFNRFFKKYTGSTPDEFRKKLFTPQNAVYDFHSKSGSK